MPDPSATDFGVGEDTDIATKSGAKPWRDIWGAGQGLGAVNAVMPVAGIVARLGHEYAGARRGPACSRFELRSVPCRPWPRRGPEVH